MPLIFSFNGNQTEFECELNCAQCTGVCANGNVCKRRSCIGTPLCWSHLLRDKHLRILPSNIGGAGKGLFALDRSAGENDVLFRKNDIIVEYSGEVINKTELSNRYGHDTAPYTVMLNEKLGRYEDAACQRGTGAIANHGNNSVANAKLSNRGGRGENVRSVLRAIKPIRNNREIIVNYGRSYHMNEQGVDYGTRRTR